MFVSEIKKYWSGGDYEYGWIETEPKNPEDWTCFVTYQDHLAAIAEMQTEIERLRKALEHYDTSHYCAICGSACSGDKTARKALEGK